MNQNDLIFILNVEIANTINPKIYNILSLHFDDKYINIIELIISNIYVINFNRIFYNMV